MVDCGTKNFPVPALAAVPACSGRVMPGERRSDRAVDLAEKPAAPAAQWDIPTRLLLQIPTALLLEPACEKPCPAPVAAGADLPDPDARSGQFPAMPPARADCECPSAPEWRAGGLHLFFVRLVFVHLVSASLPALRLHANRQTKFRLEEIPDIRFLSQAESRSRRKNRERRVRLLRDSRLRRHWPRAPDY